MPLPVSHKGYPVYGEHNFQELLGDGETVHAGGEQRKLFAAHPRNYGTHKYGSLPFAAAADFDLIPQNEWKARWDAKVAAGTTIEQRAKDALPGGDLYILDQDGLNYCHAYALVGAAMAARAINGHPFVDLSAGSVGGPVTNYRNEGARCGDDIAWMSANGAASTVFVPMDAVRRNLWLPGATEDAQKNILSEWTDMPQRSDAHAVTAILNDWPVYFGYNFMGHAMFIVGLEFVDGKLGYLVQNSWGRGWGNNGCGIWMAGRRGTPDEQYCVRSMNPNIAA